MAEQTPTTNERILKLAKILKSLKSYSDASKIIEKTDIEKVSFDSEWDLENNSNIKTTKKKSRYKKKAVSMEREWK